MDQKTVSTSDSPPPSTSEAEDPQSVAPTTGPLAVAEEGGKEPLSVPVIVLPPEEVVAPATTSADPLLDNPDYMALKKFVEERKVAGLDGSEGGLNEESLVQ